MPTTTLPLWFEVVTGISNWIMAIAAVAAVVYGIHSLSTWRRENAWKVKFDIAKNVISLATGVQREFEQIVDKNGYEITMSYFALTDIIFPENISPIDIKLLPEHKTQYFDWIERSRKNAKSVEDKYNDLVEVGFQANFILGQNIDTLVHPIFEIVANYCNDLSDMVLDEEKLMEDGDRDLCVRRLAINLGRLGADHTDRLAKAVDNLTDGMKSYIA